MYYYGHSVAKKLSIITIKLAKLPHQVPLIVKQSLCIFTGKQLDFFTLTFKIVLDCLELLTTGFTVAKAKDEAIDIATPKMILFVLINKSTNGV